MTKLPVIEPLNSGVRQSSGAAMPACTRVLGFSNITRALHLAAAGTAALRVLVATVLTLSGTTTFAAEAPMKFIKSDKAAGLSKAVVVEKVPLVHTAQFTARPGGTLAMQVNSVFKELAIALDASNS